MPYMVIGHKHMAGPGTSFAVILQRPVHTDPHRHGPRDGALVEQRLLLTTGRHLAIPRCPCYCSLADQISQDLVCDSSQPGPLLLSKAPSPSDSDHVRSIPYAPFILGAGRLSALGLLWNVGPAYTLTSSTNDLLLCSILPIALAGADML